PQEDPHRIEKEYALLIDLEKGLALIVAGVEIIDLGHAELQRGVAHGIEDRPGQTRAFNAQLASLAVERPVEPVMILGLSEDREDIVPAPARIAKLTPVVIILGLAPHIDHA